MVFGPVPLAFQELAAHVRNGYVPSSDTFVDMNSAAGTIRVVMHLGDPDKLAIERAATNQADAAVIQQRYRKFQTALLPPRFRRRASALRFGPSYVETTETANTSNRNA